MTAWQPISSAPKDGTLLLLYDPRGERLFSKDGSVSGFRAEVQLGHFHAGQWNMVDEQCGGVFTAEPTHWAPLPAPPETKT